MWGFVFNPRPLYPLETFHVTHRLWGWVGPEGSFDALENGKFPALAGNRTTFFCSPDCSHYTDVAVPDRTLILLWELYSYRKPSPVRSHIYGADPILKSQKVLSCSRNSVYFVGPDGLWPYSQEPAPLPYSVPDWAIPLPFISCCFQDPLCVFMQPRKSSCSTMWQESRIIPVFVCFSPCLFLSSLFFLFACFFPSFFSSV